MTSNHVYSQKKSNKKNTQSYNSILHESVKYREIGPFRGEDLLLLLGFQKNQIFFILEQLEVEFGKQKTVAKRMRIFLMDTLGEV